MEVMGRKEVLELRKRFPEGTRVELISMEDLYRKIPEGTCGTVMHVDDIGTIHVAWDDGCRLGLVAGVDRFRKMTEEVSHG